MCVRACVRACVCVCVYVCVGVGVMGIAFDGESQIAKSMNYHAGTKDSQKLN